MISLLTINSSSDLSDSHTSQHRSITRSKGNYALKQANVFTPSIFIAQLPQMPSRQLRRNVSVGSTSFLILISASNIIGPVLFRSSVYVCIRGFAVGSSGFQRYTWKVLMRRALSCAGVPDDGSFIVVVWLSGLTGLLADVASLNLEIGSTEANVRRAYRHCGPRIQKNRVD